MSTPEPTAEETAPSTAPRGSAARGTWPRPDSAGLTDTAEPADSAGNSAVPGPTGAPAPAAADRHDAPRLTLRGRAGSLLAEHLRPTARFLLVGGIVFLLDAAMYNLLVFWHPADGWGQGLMHDDPLTAKLLTIAAASCLTYLGNRLWTFGDRPRPDTTRSIALFILVNLIASGLQLSCLGFSRYVLGLDSVLADNISGTFIGQAVSTSFRYVTYGRFVFPRR